MNFGKIIPTLAAVAPTIASALGGPLAGMAVSALGSLFGIDAKADPDGLTQAVLSMSPDIAAKVRVADQEFAAKMKQLDIDVIALEAKDRDSARNMQIQTRDKTPRVVAAAIIAGFFGLVSLMAFRDIPVANHDVLLILVGTLAACVSSVVGFYFGSSSGSQAKDSIIQNLKGGASK